MASINTTLKIDILEADTIVAALQSYRLEKARQMLDTKTDSPDVRREFGNAERMLREFGVPLHTLAAQDAREQVSSAIPVTDQELRESTRKGW